MEEEGAGEKEKGAGEEEERGQWGEAHFSRYMRMVAPATPVPERRKTKREPSAKMKRTPWFLETEPSTGSSYANMSALAMVMPPTVVPIIDGCAATMSVHTRVGAGGVEHAR